jgi:hypothetical protein
MRELERARAELEGQRGQYTAGAKAAALLARLGDPLAQGAALRSQHGGARGKLGPLQPRAQERALASQAIRLLAQRSRLEAEQMGRATITEPLALMDEDLADHAAIAMLYGLTLARDDERSRCIGCCRGPGAGTRARLAGDPPAGAA